VARLSPVRLAAILLSIFASGCATTDNPEIGRKTFYVVIEEDPNMTTLGRQWYVSDVCFIKLKKYPICLQHEIRHCIEGNWHEGRETDEDC